MSWSAAVLAVGCAAALVASVRAAARRAARDAR